jgi:hypothetical protein
MNRGRQNLLSDTATSLHCYGWPTGLPTNNHAVSIGLAVDQVLQVRQLRSTSRIPRSLGVVNDFL